MRYLADELYIEKFRKLTDIKIKLGKKMTVFSGINGVGKSNIMSLIAMAFGSSGTRIAKGRFFPHFDEYFVITKEEYINQMNKPYLSYLKIKAGDGFIQKRLGLKDDSNEGRGIRVIPRVTNFFTEEKTVEEVDRETKKMYNIGHSGRVPVPTIFISLSRLYPMGETELEENNITDSNEIVRDGAIEKYIEWYNRVLPDSINVDMYRTSKIKKVVNTNGRIHVKLEDSDARTQSIGEDNLGTIISALVDFYYLKQKQKDNYIGGIICIDEVDASLHPSAQIRLFELLEDLTDDLQLQVLMTTHSMTMLEKIIKKQNRNNEDYKLIYLLDPRLPRIKKNVNSIEDIKADMFDERSFYKPIIKVYCEDSETKFIFDELIKTVDRADKNKSEKLSLPEYKVFPMSLGHKQLEGLRNFDKYFESVVILVDGDSKKESDRNFLNDYLNNDIEGFQKRDLKENILALPTFLAPESYYYYILKQILFEDRFWKKLEDMNLENDYTSHNLKRFLDSAKFEDENNIKNDELKKLFDGENLAYIKDFISKTQLLSYYYEKNPEELLTFKDEVQRVFNIVENKVKANM